MAARKQRERNWKQNNMKKEYDFSKGIRGRFYNADAEFNLPTDLKSQEKNFMKFVDEVAKLFLNPSYRMQLTIEVSAIAPQAAGVYAIYDKGSLIYAGETRNLKNRLSDIFKTKKHTFRRTLGELKFADYEGYTKASTREKFCDTIENELNTYCSENLTIFWIPILVGRKEIEELIISQCPNTLNKIKGN